MLVAADARHRRRLSARRHRRRAGWSFPAQANGSLIERDGKAVGSALIGQPFGDPKYFWGRPSATAPMPVQRRGVVRVEPRARRIRRSPTRCKGRIEALRAADPGNAAPVPVDLVTASGSGLDPHISPAAAEYQVGAGRAGARHRRERRVRALVAEHTEGRQLGVLGEPRVNVLALNLALDASGHARPSAPAARVARSAC